MPPTLATLDPYLPPDTPRRPEPGADAQDGDDEADIVRWLQAKAARDQSGTSDLPPDPAYQLAQAIPIPSGPAGTPVPGASTPDVAPYQGPDWVPDFLRRPLTPEAVQESAQDILEGIALPRLGHPFRSGSRMDPAPDLPPLPPSEPPPDRPDTGTEVFPGEIPIYTIPGLEIPEVKEPQVLIFPDLSGENDPSLIVESRRGNDATRAHIDAVRDEVLRQHPDWKHIGGGTKAYNGQQRQEYRIPGPAGAMKDPETGRSLDSRPGSNFLDLTFELPDGRHVHVQTVDIDRYGKPSADELEAAYRVFRATRESVYLIPKPWQVREPRR